MIRTPTLKSQSKHSHTPGVVVHTDNPSSSGGGFQVWGQARQLRENLSQTRTGSLASDRMSLRSIPRTTKTACFQRQCYSEVGNILRCRSWRRVLRWLWGAPSVWIVRHRAISSFMASWSCDERFALVPASTMMYCHTRGPTQWVPLKPWAKITLFFF